MAIAVKHFWIWGKRELTVAKVAETFGYASETETLCEFRYE
ncbi:hypothetical protein RMSM_07607 [Rhodopirellula maiorica SM1]|uniref:Uncharacterized protein n=1 Tax=Rhodopirellula maiorica SM1 TaxID=1265738 RepID=M5RJB8_9BACT|nr:hypothetical protein RMSM_07607 [Rhodopirellula maiorica SM1]